MTDTTMPDALTFDIATVLQDRAYPEIEVPFFLDEGKALEISRAERKLTQLALLGKTEEHDALDAQVAELKASLRADRYTYHLRGIPNKVRQDALAQAFEKYPKKTNVLGVLEDDDDRDGFFTALLWQSMTVKIASPTGAVQVNPTIEAIVNFRDYAPLATLDAIGTAIQELTTGVAGGFEAAAQETDFLSKP